MRARTGTVFSNRTQTNGSPSEIRAKIAGLIIADGETAMEEVFENRVWAAAAAGWWTLLIGAGFLVLQWIAYLLFMSTRPTWILSLWGNGISWDTVQNVWFWGAAIFKLCLWLFALIVTWLTLWAWQLRKQTGRS
jgi:hypothetical protein